ncbi:MAG: excisionase family protein [Cyanobacteria bacterium P01_A01_bin.37]
MSLWISRDEAMQLIDCRSRKTLRKYRQEHWTEGAHYQIINPNKVMYHREMIEDWLATRHDPSSHLKKIRKKLKS